MCHWQIPVQRNEAHRHSGSCDSFLRPDGTQCYPRDLILAPPAPHCWNRNLYALMTHCSYGAGHNLWAILLKRGELRPWPCWCMMLLPRCLSWTACVGLERSCQCLLVPSDLCTTLHPVREASLVMTHGFVRTFSANIFSASHMWRENHSHIERAPWSVADSSVSVPDLRGTSGVQDKRDHNY